MKKYVLYSMFFTIAVLVYDLIIGSYVYAAMMAFCILVNLATLSLVNRRENRERRENDSI